MRQFNRFVLRTAYFFLYVALLCICHQMKATLFSSLRKHNTTECRECHWEFPLPHLKPIYELPNRKENCFWPLIQVCATQMHSLPRLRAQHIQKAAMCQSYYACNLEWGSRKYKPFHTPYTCAFASTQRTLTRQAEHSCRVLLFMRHAVRGTPPTCLLACAHSLSEHLLCKL